MEIEPQSLTDAGNTMQSAAEAFSQTLTAFQARLAAIGPAFGDDEAGSILGVAYEEASGYVFEVIAEALEEIGFAGEDLVTSAEAHQANEDDNAGLFHGLSSRLGDS
jgi:hypothetical protein